MQVPRPSDYLPHLAYDSVVFGFAGEQLRILILEYRNTGYHALPGGFVGRDENLDEAVRRGLRERTGLDNLHLQQFHTFGSTRRHQPEVMRTILSANGFPVDQAEWMLDRFITVGYYSLINYHLVTPRPDALSDSLKWYAIDELPPLLWDHREMVDKALYTLRRNLDTMLIGTNMLPERFTIKQLQQVTEAILGEKLHRTSFQRRMLSSGNLLRHEKLYTGGSHKAPYLYSFVTAGEGD
ncbi:NUDIX domain-containing protein [Lewinella sp. JB7]|uniref:NUDIX hydrolase n=1 Tax=Lewinella sp. JB7 TaxID=2962887 RepID=UPI0020C9761B|nr:NUDIX domain-containing protein [Lewinella sp. JB7]MCP9235740.1 NUDIX domain-containing protein [Lewinella sp. JB7]